LQAPVQHIVHLGSEPDPVLRAELEEETPIGMSGMSGAPVYHVNVESGAFTPIGIVYEGNPSDAKVKGNLSTDAEDDGQDGSKIFNRRWLQFKAWTLNPRQFQAWIEVFDKQLYQVMMKNIRIHDLDSLGSFLVSQDVSLESISKLKEAINADESVGEFKDKEDFGPKVKECLEEVIKKAGSCDWNISEKTARLVITKALEKYYGY
jgi:hypothetical protein